MSNELNETLTDEQAFATLYDEDEAPKTGAGLTEEQEPEAPEGEPEDPGPSEPQEPDSDEEPQKGEPERSSDDPEPTVKQKSASDPGKADKPPKIDNEPAWFKGLSDEDRDQAKKEIQTMADYSSRLHQSYQAVYGRLAPVQQQNEDLQKRLLKIEQGEAPTLKDLEDNDGWKAISEDLPEEAAQVKKVFASQARAIQNQQAQSQKTASGLSQFHQKVTSREFQRLEQMFPNARAITQTPHFSHWRNAVQSQPTQYPDIAEAMGSPFAEESAYVLQKFCQDMEQYFPDEASQMFQAGQAQQQASSADPQKPTQRREPPPPSPPSQGSGVSGSSGRGKPMTPEEQFASLF